MSVTQAVSQGRWPSAELIESEIGSLAALYAARARATPDWVACRWFDAARQSWCDLSWQGLQRLAQRYACSLECAGLSPGDRVALQIPNGPDWLAIDWACQTLGLVTVGLYHEDTPSSVSSMLVDSGARCVFLSDQTRWDAVRQTANLPTLERVVLMQGDNAPSDLRACTLSAWLLDASDMPEEHGRCDALASIVYTSGATGCPKGVMLSQGNVLANVFACRRAIAPEPCDVMLSVLPLAHMFERTAGAYMAVACGATTVYGRGSAYLAEDLQQQRPTVLIAVPRLFERVHGALVCELNKAPAARRALFRLAVETGWMAHQRSQTTAKVRLLPTGIARRAGQHLRERLGGRLRLAISGGAALSPEISRTFIALGLPVMQGYGLTEAGPVVSTNRLGDNEPCSVGTPLDNVQIRVSASGELFVRSPSVMMGYWRDPEATRLALDDAGWLHTGDKVSRLDTRRIYLTGRIKDVIVTANGEKAAPAEIEKKLRESPLIDQVMVVGEARPYLGALVVPDPAALQRLKDQLGLHGCEDAAHVRAGVEEWLLRGCQELLRHAPKNHQIRRVVCVDRSWNVSNSMLTASHKLRRGTIARLCAADIDRLYTGHFTAPKTDCSANSGV